MSKMKEQRSFSHLLWSCSENIFILELAYGVPAKLTALLCWVIVFRHDEPSWKHVCMHAQDSYLLLRIDQFTDEANS